MTHPVTSPRTPSQSTVVEEIDSLERFAALEPEWNDLLARSSHDTLCVAHEWLTTWWRHFGCGARLAIVVGRTGGRLHFAFPLMETPGRVAHVPLRLLHSLTNSWSFHFHPLVERGAEEEVARSFLDYLHRRDRRWDCLVLADVPSGVRGVGELLAAAAADGHPAGAWRASDSPFVEVAGDWEGYLAGLKRKHRYNLRSRAKRLAELGPVSYPVLARPSDADVEEGLAIEAKGWKGERGSAMLSTPAVASFFREWFRIAAERGWLRLAFLESAGRRVAVDFTLVRGGTVYPFKIGYDPAFATYSPGQLLCAENLRRTFAGEFGTGIREYNFLGAFTPQKRDWTAQCRQIAWIHLYNRTLRGRIGHWVKFRLAPRLRTRRPASTGGSGPDAPDPE
jgi:CelD/BcsL family acetyltransferase involved in cellulose biosynthesis